MKLQDYFKFKMPVKDGVYWNGKPYEHSNLQQWNCYFSQGFAENPAMYAQFNMDGHNGIDIAYKEGCPVVAPCRMYVTMLADAATSGYGNGVYGETEIQTIEGKEYKCQLVFGHFSKNVAKAGKWYNEGEVIGLGGTTGFSTGNHLHFGIRPMKKRADGQFDVVNYGNGYLGYVDPQPFMPKLYTFDDIANLINNEEYMTFKKEKTSPDIYMCNDELKTKFLIPTMEVLNAFNGGKFEEVDSLKDYKDNGSAIWTSYFIN